MQYAIIYFILISAASFIITVHDKRAAQKGAWRVPEKTLFITAALGGALAMYLTMRSIHHKTLHKRFMIGLPIIFVLQIVAVCLLFYFFS